MRVKHCDIIGYKFMFVQQLLPVLYAKTRSTQIYKFSVCSWRTPYRFAIVKSSPDILHTPVLLCAQLRNGEAPNSVSGSLAASLQCCKLQIIPVTCHAESNRLWRPVTVTVGLRALVQVAFLWQLAAAARAHGPQQSHDAGRAVINTKRALVTAFRRDGETQHNDVINHTAPLANTRSWPNDVSMLGQRRRRWANIETTSGQPLVLAGRDCHEQVNMARQCGHK